MGLYFYKKLKASANDRLNSSIKTMELTEQLWTLLHVVIAAILGGLIGWERESRDKPAGLRTNMLIAGASALLVVLATELVQQMQLTLDEDAMGVDPTRIVHAIIVGVSFIGAGTILKGGEKFEVRYLTTAASLLFSAGAGISMSLELYWIAGGVTVLGLLINAVVKKLE